MSIVSDINYFYFKMAMYELQVMNENDYFNGLSYNSVLYLNVISLTENCTVSKIAEKLKITKSAVTIKIGELVKQGAVEKIQSADDKRVFYIRLTADIDETIGLYDEVFGKIEKELMQKYTKPELDIFSSVLHTISGFEWKKA